MTRSGEKLECELTSKTHEGLKEIRFLFGIFLPPQSSYFLVLSLFIPYLGLYYAYVPLASPSFSPFCPLSKFSVLPNSITNSQIKLSITAIGNKTLLEW